MPVAHESWYFQSLWLKCPGNTKKTWRISESINSFLFPKHHKTYFWGGQILSAESIPMMPTLVHLPKENEIIAADTFPQYTRIGKTFHKRTNQHLLHRAAHEHSTVRLFFLEPLIFSNMLFAIFYCTSTLLEYIVSPNCFTSAYNLFPFLSTKTSPHVAHV